MRTEANEKLMGQSPWLKQEKTCARQSISVEQESSSTWEAEDALVDLIVNIMKNKVTEN